MKNGIMSVYDFFKHCIDEGISRKGVCVASSKQYVFYGDLEDKYRVHYDIAHEIEKLMAPYLSEDDILCGFSDHAYIFAEERTLMLITAESNELSYPQIELLCKFLDEIGRVNAEVPLEERIAISFVNRLTGNMLETSDVEMVKEELRSNATKKMTVKREAIVGEVLSENELKEAVSKQINGNFRVKREMRTDDYFGKVVRETSRVNSAEDVSRGKTR